MATKRTYEELEKRVQILEEKLASHKNLIGSGQLDQRYLEAILSNTNMPVFLKNGENKYIFMNRQFEFLAGVTFELARNKDDFAIFSEPVAQLFRSQDEEVVRCRQLIEFEETILLPDGVHTFITVKFPLFDSEGTLDGVGGICTDITARKQAEEALLRAQEELEQRVADRTAQLDRKTERLKETNVALKILLEKREEDRKELEEKVLFNVEKRVYPYLEKLKMKQSDASRAALLKIIQTNLDEITSSFSESHKNYLSNLTPTQVQIADLIKHGHTTKEIASLLNLSPATIACHRQEIRKRLFLTNKKTNLQTALTASS